MNLKEIDLLRGIREEDFNEIEAYFIPVSHRKKGMIFSEGDPSDWLYIVKTGKVKITKVSQEGKEIILEIISPKEFFGGVAVLKKFPYPANAFAMEDSELLKISRKDLLRILDRFPNLMFSMMRDLGERMKDSHEALKNIALERVEARIASLLLKLADKAGQLTEHGTLIELKLTKQDIAEMVGTTVETSIRTLSKFKREGIVSEREGKILIKDKKTLKKVGS